MYEVTVRASDGRLNTDRMVTIKVTDADEAGKVEVPQDALIGVELTATLTDSDTGAPDHCPIYRPGVVSGTGFGDG